MIDVIVKDGISIITINPTNKKEEQLLKQILDTKSLQEHKMTEREYWTFGNSESNNNVQMTMDFEVVNDDENPFTNEVS